MFNIMHVDKSHVYIDMCKYKCVSIYTHTYYLCFHVCVCICTYVHTLGYIYLCTKTGCVSL